MKRQTVAYLRLVSAPAAPTGGDDPVLNLIECHRAAWAAYNVASNARTAREEGLGRGCNTDAQWQRLNHTSDEQYDLADQLLVDMIEIQPTTIAGVAALLAYASDWIAHHFGSFPEDLIEDDLELVVDTDRWAVHFHANMSRALLVLASGTAHG